MYENSKIVQPFTPAEARKAKATNIRPEVVEAANELIAKHLTTSGSAEFTLEELAALVLAKMANGAEWRGEAVRRLMFEERWLDIEELYRSFGWQVNFDGSGYTESGPSKFVFRSK